MRISKGSAFRDGLSLVVLSGSGIERKGRDDDKIFNEYSIRRQSYSSIISERAGIRS